MSQKCIPRAITVLPSLEQGCWEHHASPADLMQRWVHLCLLTLSRTAVNQLSSSQQVRRESSF